MSMQLHAPTLATPWQYNYCIMKCIILSFFIFLKYTRDQKRKFNPFWNKKTQLNTSLWFLSFELSVFESNEIFVFVYRYVERVDPICHCGYKRSEHEHSGKFRSLQPQDSQPWDVDNNTASKMTNAFGEVEFVGYGDTGRQVSGTVILIG